jgi:hypothetical protein
MPQSAMEHVDVDYCLPWDQIAPLLIDLTGRLVTSPTVPIPRELETEVRIDRQAPRVPPRRGKTPQRYASLSVAVGPSTCRCNLQRAPVCEEGH